MDYAISVYSTKWLCYIITLWIFKACAEGDMKNRDIFWRRYTIRETLYIVHIVHGTVPPQSLQTRHLWTSHSSLITISCPVIFSWISSTVWNFFPFKREFNFGKSLKSQDTKSGLQRGWVTCVIWCFTKTLCTRHDAWVGMLSR